MKQVIINGLTFWWNMATVRLHSEPTNDSEYLTLSQLGIAERRQLFTSLRNNL